jgi:hypothetical protein
VRSAPASGSTSTPLGRPIPYGTLGTKAGSTVAIGRAVNLGGGGLPGNQDCGSEETGAPDAKLPLSAIPWYALPKADLLSQSTRTKRAPTKAQTSSRLGQGECDQRQRKSPGDLRRFGRSSIEMNWRRRLGWSETNRGPLRVIAPMQAPSLYSSPAGRQRLFEPGRSGSASSHLETWGCLSAQSDLTFVSAMAAHDEVGRRARLVASIVIKARAAPDPREYIRNLTLGALRSLSSDGQLPAAKKPDARREIHDLMKLATNELLAARLGSTQVASKASAPEGDLAAPPEDASPRGG